MNYIIYFFYNNNNNMIQNKSIAFLLSTSVLTIPLGLFLVNKDYKLLVFLFIGAFFDKCISKNIFYDIFPKDITNRPNKGYECGLFLSNTNNKGFPSGHVMLGTFIALYIYHAYPKYKWTSFVYLFLIAWSRYINGCHTLFQIISGMAFGSLLFLAFRINGDTIVN